MQDPLKLIGKKFGKCIIQKPLAKGGYGYSYIGYDPELDKKRVIKVSRVESGFEEAGALEIENFRREGIILSRLNHPQIVALMEQGEKYGFRYMIIDFIEGYDLIAVMNIIRTQSEKQGCGWSELMDPGAALAIVLSALEPLAYSHQVKISLPGEEIVEGLAHRDISAGNLILGRGHESGGKVHLIDFGIAKSNFDISLTVSTGIIGSLKYMSPMRFMKKELRERNDPYWSDFRQTQHDVHAMGCLLWELLAGRSHLESDEQDMAELLVSIQNPAVYSRLYHSAESFDSGIHDIIRKSIILPGMKDAESRLQYQSAVEMRDSLQKVFSHFTGEVRPEVILHQLSENLADPERIPRKKRRKSSFLGKTVYSGRKLRRKGPLKSVLAAGLLLLVLAGLAARFFYSDRKTGKMGQDATVSLISLADTDVSQGEGGTAMREIDSAESLRIKRPDTLPAASAEPVLSEKARLQKSFEAVLLLVRKNEIDSAYKGVKQLLRDSDDPALFIIQADLIKRKNPNTDKIAELLEKAGSRTSILMADKELRQHISRLNGSITPNGTPEDPGSPSLK